MNLVLCSAGVILKKKKKDDGYKKRNHYFFCAPCYYLDFFSLFHTHTQLLFKKCTQKTIKKKKWWGKWWENSEIFALHIKNRLLLLLNFIIIFLSVTRPSSIKIFPFIIYLPRNHLQMSMFIISVPCYTRDTLTDTHTHTHRVGSSRRTRLREILNEEKNPYFRKKL